jgi:uncharacterized protein YecT (DUF1311 family)
MSVNFRRTLSLALVLNLGRPALATASSVAARDFDFESYLAKPYKQDCSVGTGQKLVYLNDVSFYDFDQDGQEEAIVVASSCMTGTAGPDIHAVYRVKSSSEAVEVPIEEAKTFQGRPIFDQLVGNANSRFYVDQGRLVKTFYDGSGREHPLKVFYKFDAGSFKVAKVEWPKTYRASFDCAKARSENEIIICAHADLADADLGLAQRYRALLKKTPADARKSLQSEQAGWLKERDKICIPYKGDRGADCLREQYAKRREQLSKR